MNLSYLAVERDIGIQERESQFWLSRGISSVQVTSMREAIEAASKNQFIYIGINAANIDYLPCLSVLRGATNDPIFIATTSYTMQEQGLTLDQGADSFGQISDNPNDNYNSVMAGIKRCEARSKQRKPTLKIATYKNVLLVYKYRLAFVDDIRVDLTKLEFNLLFLLMSNRGQVFTFEQLYRNVWESDYNLDYISVRL